MFRHLYNTRTWKWALALVALACYSTASYAIDWSGVPSKKVVLFYPGQASWEWILTQSDHGGAVNFRKGKDCRVCHEGEEKDIGAKIASGKKLEPDPIAGKPGSVPVNISFARDDDTLYVKFEWKDTGFSGGAKSDYKERVTMMFGTEDIKEAARAGCWGTCHNDLKGMPDDAGLSKYLTASRTKMSMSGGGTNYKSDAEIKELLDKGHFMEFWQAAINPGKPAEGIEGYILKDRQEDKASDVKAEASLKDGTWTVILSRKLNVSGDGKRSIVAGQVYPVGFAIHDDYAEHRHHYVSFEHTFAIDSGTADFVAVKR
ncbi:MAG TPA: ethylbenzene dehydrogenase-related protein [Pseudomonadales bacterium]|nr:ethylbenzene dehydrogenase-related protein [Pseudomonadales bacterium]